MVRSWETSWHRSKHLPAAARQAAWLKRYRRAQAIRRHRRDAPGWSWFVRSADDLKLRKREMARALRKYLHAPDGFAACGMLVQYPLLQMESARERLKRAIASARARGNMVRAHLLEHRLALLEVVCKGGMIAAMRILTQKDQQDIFAAENDRADTYDI